MRPNRIVEAIVFSDLKRMFDPNLDPTRTDTFISKMERAMPRVKRAETQVELQKFHLRVTVQPELPEVAALTYLENLGYERLTADHGEALYVEKIDRWCEDGAGGQRIAHVCFYITPLTDAT